MKNAQNQQVRQSRGEANLFLLIMAISFGLFLLLGAFSCTPAQPAEVYSLKVEAIQDDHTVLLKSESGKITTIKVENAYSQAYEVGQVILIVRR